MKTKIISVILLTIFVAIAIFVSCEEKPTKPEYNNVFDPMNPETSGDPFHLQAVIGDGGVTLTWTKPISPNLASFKVYRSEKETSGYSVLSTVSAATIQYVDQTVKNVHSYWYRIAAVDGNGNETSTTNVSSMNIKTHPLLVINSGDQYTITKDVSLTIIANTAQQMKISNAGDFSGANWEATNTSKNWTLLTGEGKKIVYMILQYDGSTESNIVRDSITLDTTIPTPILEVSPDSGITNDTQFQFDPTASNDNLAPLADMQVRFDWENDGTHDTNWQQLSIINYQYPTGGGDKTVKIEIRDGAGWTMDTTTQIFVNSRPAVSFIAAQDAVNDYLFHFDASASSDYEDGTNLQYRWDFNVDGSWETGWLVRDTISYSYSTAGDFLPTLLARDLNNLAAEITVSINVFKDTVTDIDGNVYQAVKICNQWWMAENLKVTHYRNGNAIANVTDYTEWSNLSTGAYCNYANGFSNVATYGRLYNWYAVADSRNIAPAGWHVASDDEWQILVDYLGGSSVAGSKMKESGTAYWTSPNTDATNSSGFSALPGGAL